MINKKKKKGFTLVELIAVIAILAILGAVLVPRVSGYSVKANKSKDLANAKMLVQAIEMYNQDNPTATLDDNVTLATRFTTQAATETAFKPYLSNFPKAPSAPGTGVTAGTTWISLTPDGIRAYASSLES